MLKAGRSARSSKIHLFQGHATAAPPSSVMKSRRPMPNVI
jgi:hypothetical protein